MKNTVSNWIKENGRRYQYCDFVICHKDNSIILDDRLAYLPRRSDEYNKSWKAKCRGKEIIEVKQIRKGVCLVID